MVALRLRSANVQAAQRTIERDNVGDMHLWRPSGGQPMFRRFVGNPILSAAEWPYPATSVFNPGAVRLADGSTLLLVRVEDRQGISHLTVARSADGLTDWRIDAGPSMKSQPDTHPEELWGIEDPRVVWIPELDVYAITHTAYSPAGPMVALALTRDFVSFERRGAIMPADNKDAALFPRRFGGRWVLIHRPEPTATSAKANMWISFSEDLVHWGDHRVLIEARAGMYWDARRIGLAGPPIETAEGWLTFYHGAQRKTSGTIYRLGVALLDLDDPTRVISRGNEWIFRPEAPYELTGDVSNVVFPCGATLDPATEEVRIYYGAADTCVAVATAHLSDVLYFLRSSGGEAHTQGA